jgi:hypothetical protein
LIALAQFFLKEMFIEILVGGGVKKQRKKSFNNNFVLKFQSSKNAMGLKAWFKR